jgi:hypothetical protein
MSVRMVSAGEGFALGFRCNACSRPEIIALVPPAGWEALQTEQGELLHRCWDCRFWNIVEPLKLDLGWREAA